MFMQDPLRFARSAAPVRTSAAAAPRSGMAAGTVVETAAGWQPVEELRVGDRVHSLDGGLVRIAGLDRRWLLPDPAAHLLHVPGGAFGNCSDLDLLPGQPLLIDTLGSRDDALFVLARGAALEGHRGIRRRPLTVPVEVVTLFFAEEEAIWAQSGLLMRCPSLTEAVDALPQDGFYPVASAAEIRFLLLHHALAA